MKYSILEIYKGGIELAQKNTFWLMFWIVGNLIAGTVSFLAGLSLHWSVYWISIALSIVLLGFYLSLPIFIVRKQENVNLSVLDFVIIIFKSTLKLIKPFALMFFALVILSLAAVLISSNALTSSSLSTISSTLVPVSLSVSDTFQLSGFALFYTLIYSLFCGFAIFVPVYSSLKNYSLINSLRKSSLLALNNIYFSLTIIFISLITMLVSLSVASLDIFLVNILYGTLLAVISFITGLSGLFLYQKTAKD